MKVIRSLLLLIVFAGSLAQAQPSNDYVADLTDLYASIKKLPSYNAQIKGKREAEYKKLFEHLKAEKPKDAFDRFYKLSQLMIPLKDNHLFLTETVAETSFPRVNINLNALERKLKVKTLDDVEGIYYHYGGALKLALYRTAKPGSLLGVILTSDYPNWHAGDIAFVLKEYAPNQFRNYYAYLNLKTYGLDRHEKFINGALVQTWWRKSPHAKDHINISNQEPIYQFRNLGPGVQYMRLGSFDSGDDKVVVSQKFFDRIKDSLTAANVIVDLRNNGGGRYKSSAKFMKLLQDHALKGNRLFIMVNNHTVSDAEQVTVRIKKFDNVTLLGQATNGKIAYGNNTGRSDTLSSKRVRLYITDMRDSGNYIRYEDTGVLPNVFLKHNEDWIGQVLNYIKK